MSLAVIIKPAELEDLFLFEQGLIYAKQNIDPFLKKGKKIYYKTPQQNTYIIDPVCNNKILGYGHIKPKFRGKNTSNIISFKILDKDNQFKKIPTYFYNNNFATIKPHEKFGCKSSMITL